MSNKSLKNTIWSFFGSIRCINLRSRKDRFEQAQSVFTAYSIPVTWFFTDRHPNGGIQGCFESHLSCISQSYLKGDETCLIFEDDVVDSVYAKNTKLLQEAINFMNNNQTWELFYLGTCPDILGSKTYSVRSYPSVLNMRSLCTHAYVIHRRYMEKIIKTSFSNVPIDYIYLFNQQAYGIYPSIFYQRASGSDISGDFWNLIPVKHLWFRLIEIYAKYINRPIRKIVGILSLGFIMLILLYFINPQLRKIWLIGTLIFLLILISSS